MPLRYRYDAEVKLLLQLRDVLDLPTQQFYPTRIVAICSPDCGPR
jgi:hypothetical protein